MSGIIRDVEERTYYVYIASSLSKVLYIGVTNDIERRIAEHKRKEMPGFTAKYNVNRLAYYEAYAHIEVAIDREKQLKRWRRSKKVALIEGTNPGWRDLSEDWAEDAGGNLNER